MQLAGVTDDIQALIAQGPTLIKQTVTIVQKVGPHINFILSVVEDPALPVAVKKIQTLKSLYDANEPPIPTTPATPPTAHTTKGVGLNRALPILDAAIWYEKNRKWAPWAAGGGVLLLLGGIFALGRASVSP